MQLPGRESACFAGASSADVLRLLGIGATGAILMALGEGPMRTKALTEQVSGYTARTIYRYAGQLSELEMVDREEEFGVPSKVVYALSDPCGTDLHAVVNRFAGTSLTRLPDGRLDARAWTSLSLLADMWEAGMVESLSWEGHSPTELARGQHELSYHQINRRTGLFKAGGLLEEWQGPGRRRCYGLTRKTRRDMGMLVGIARWRNKHVVAGDEVGMTAVEMATALRVALPLMHLPDHCGECLQMNVVSEDASESEEVWTEVRDDGTVHSCSEAPTQLSSSGSGKVGAWIPLLLEGDSRGISTTGSCLAADSLAVLYAALWTQQLV